MRQVRYQDLRATVYPDSAPDGALSELPQLYSSVFSTVEWWETQDKKRPTGCCVLDDPRHVIAFVKDGDTVQVLNKVFHIDPADTERACRAIFRAFPDTHRIRIEILYPPHALRLPTRSVASADHMVIDLPSSVAAYDASLGKKTRGNLRNFQNRLRRDHADVVTEVLPSGDRSDALLTQLIMWKNEFFRERGRESFWEAQPEQQDLYREFLRRRSEAHVTSVDGRIAAIRFMCPVGRATVSLQGAFDPAYKAYRLGLLSSYWALCDAIERGLVQANLLWGTPDYKAHLGATPRTAVQVSVFRSQAARLYSLDEATTVLKRRARSAGVRGYWDARHRTGRALRKARDAATRSLRSSP